jgi:acyl-CoA thioester hydrolase
MIEQHIGPILFREEALFRKEVRPDDELFITVAVTKLRRDASRFSFRHELIRARDNAVCAIMNIDGAWIDTQLRKLTAPPASVLELMENAPRAEDFEWV